jgi:acyl-CoA thioester hydrolase
LKANYSIKIVVPYGDVDMMNHVNNARYLTYFEDVRSEFLCSGDRPIDLMETGIIIARAEIDYKSPSTWRDELTVKIRTSYVGDSSWIYEYEILNEKKNRLVAVGKTVQVAYDYGAKKSVPIPEEFRERLLHEVEVTKEDGQDIGWGPI